MNEEIIQELKEIKKLLQVIVSKEEQVINQTNKLTLDGQVLGEIVFKNDVSKMPDFKSLTNRDTFPKK